MRTATRHYAKALSESRMMDAPRGSKRACRRAQRRTAGPEIAEALAMVRE